MNRLHSQRVPMMPHGVHDQRGLTVVEILVAAALMGIITGAITILMGASVQSKMISAARSNDTETARITLGWMADRLRQAGLNNNKSDAQTRCQDRVVANASDTALQPKTASVYVSGEIPYISGNPGTNVRTIGYYLQTDATTGNQVVMEYNQLCSAGATNIAANSVRLSSPKVSVTTLAFTYFNESGAAITGSGLTTTATIRTIKIIGISMTVKGVEGTSKLQAQTFQRFVMLWDLDPQANSWVDPVCTGTSTQCGY